MSDSPRLPEDLLLPAFLEGLLRQAFPQEVQDPEGVLRLGREHLEQGRPAQALPYFERATRLQPLEAEGYYLTGIAFIQIGRPRDAVVALGEAVRLRPTFADAYYHLGSSLTALGRAEDALECYRQAVGFDPGHRDALIDYGVALARRGQSAEAEQALRRAVDLGPDSARAHYNLGVFLAQKGRLDLAETSLRRALEIQPTYAEAFCSLGNVLNDRGQREAAIASYREAIDCRPDHVDALVNLGFALSETGRSGEAAILLKHATRLRPDSVDALSNLGLALTELGRFEEAATRLEQALDRAPFDARVHTNLGNTLKEMGRTEEAIASYEMALRIDPASASTHWNLALTLLQQGEYRRGWAEYEWRTRTRWAQARLYPAPLWDGSPLEGRTILLYAEQGLGDAVQWARFVPQVQARGGRTLVVVPRLLCSLFRTLPGADQVLSEGDPLPPYTICASLQSLPHLLGCTLQNLPHDVPYLRPDPPRVTDWRNRLADLPGLRIGVCWQGNPYHKWDRFRSIPLRALAPLAAVPGVHLIALQKEFGREQVPALQGAFEVIDFGDNLGEPPACFQDTASLLSTLDLVITVDTAVAHVAGALGRPTWVMLPASFVDWRWLRGREDSPWYPTLRLFRQQELGNWDPVILRMSHLLRDRLRER